MERSRTEHCAARRTSRGALSTRLSCFTSTAPLATPAVLHFVPAFLHLLPAVLQLHQHLLHLLHLRPAVLHFFTRRLLLHYLVTRRLAPLALAAPPARRPSLAALALHSRSAPHSCTCSTAPPCTAPLCACVFLSVPRQIRLVLFDVSGPLLHTEMAVAPRAACECWCFGEPWWF